MQVQVGDIVRFDTYGRHWVEHMRDLVGQPIEVFYVLSDGREFEGTGNWTYFTDEISEIISGPSSTLSSTSFKPGDIEVGDLVTLTMDCPISYHIGIADRGRTVKVEELMNMGNVDNDHNCPLWKHDGWWRSYKDIASLENESLEMREERAARRLKAIEGRQKAIEKQQKELEKQMEGYCLTLDKVGTIAKDVFGEEFVMTMQKGLGFKVIIHLPEINMSNSAGLTHTIRDMFVCFTVDRIALKEGFKFYSNLISCTKTTYSLKEAATDGYVHSHISTGFAFPRNDGEFNSDFCMGSSEYLMCLTNLRMNPTPENWYLVFLGLKSFLSWESLEGGPYRLIKDLSKGGGNSIGDAALFAEAKKWISEIPPEFWEYSSAGFVLNPHNPAIVQFFNEKSSIKSLYRNKRSVEDIYADYKFTPFKFNDKVFKFKIIEEDADQDQEKGFIEHDVVIAYCSLLQRKIQEFTKIYMYDLSKSTSKVFTQIETFKQAQARDYASVAKADR